MEEEPNPYSLSNKMKTYGIHLKEDRGADYELMSGEPDESYPLLSKVLFQMGYLWFLGSNQ